jgi:hypothetical protein
MWNGRVLRDHRRAHLRRSKRLWAACCRMSPCSTITALRGVQRVNVNSATGCTSVKRLPQDMNESRGRSVHLSIVQTKVAQSLEFLVAHELQEPPFHDVAFCEGLGPVGAKLIQVQKHEHTVQRPIIGLVCLPRDGVSNGMRRRVLDRALFTRLFLVLMAGVVFKQVCRRCRRMRRRGVHRSIPRREIEGRRGSLA